MRRHLPEHWSAIAILALATLLLSACAAPGRKYDAGAVSHRMVGQNGGFYHKYFTSTEREKLTLLESGDSVSIRINAIFICDFAENNPFPDSLFRAAQAALTASGKDEKYPPEPCSKIGLSHTKHYTQGEIVVLADVFEQGGSRTIAYSKNGFDAKDARVIYYDDDVRESGQFLNIANIPVYGPIRYGGNPLFLRIFILELDDEENKQSSAMLKKLADLGGKAYPPASAVLQTLSSVGDALLSGEQDDLEFRYTMVFDPHPGESRNYLPLAVGDYMLVKMGNRSEDFDWSKQIYDATDGGFTRGSPAHRSATFVSFKVSKNEPALQQDGMQLYSEFEATLPANGIDLSLLEGATGTLAKQYQSASLMDQARAYVQTLNMGVSSGKTTSANFVQADSGLAQLICDSKVVKSDEDEPGNSLPENDILYILRSLSPSCLNASMRATLEQWRSACASHPISTCTAP